jgi:hypothetical protein
VRRARVQDHDEIAPLLQRAAARHPSLARLPDSCRPDEPFALTRLIGSQDAGNAVLVAQRKGGGQLVGGCGDDKLMCARCQPPYYVHLMHALYLFTPRQAAVLRGWGGGMQLPHPRAVGFASMHPPNAPRAQVGFAVATCDVDVPLLHEAFDLGPFDGFLAPELYERLEDAAAAQAAADADACARGADGGADRGAETAAGARRRLAGLVRGALAAAGGGGGAAGGGGGGDGGGGHRLLALTMLCMEPGWEASAGDLLGAAFEAFPDKVGRRPGRAAVRGRGWGGRGAGRRTQSEPIGLHAITAG